MNDEATKTTNITRIWGEGWDAYWFGLNQDSCPNYSDQEERDEWMMGWLSAQSADKYC